MARATEVEVTFSQEARRKLDRLTAAIEKMGNPGVELKYVVEKPTEQDPTVRYRVFDILTAGGRMSSDMANEIVSALESNGIRFVVAEG